jgi:ABC-type uncharacterized transport system ATPase subunit
MVNDKFIQLHGPFSQNEELIDRIKKNYSDFKSIKQIGIQSQSTNICCINGQNFEIGKTGILELNEVNITSIYFKQDELATTLVDCLLK